MDISTYGSGLQSAGLASAIVGSFYKSKADKSALRHQAAMQDINARLAETSAQTELTRGQREEHSVRLRTAQIKSSQRASMASNGIDLGEGTAANIQLTTDIMGEADADTVQANAVRSAWGYRTQSASYSSDAGMRRAGAAGISPIGSALTTALTGAGTVARNWYQYNKSKPSGYQATDISNYNQLAIERP
jgi:hypothetical protein